MNTEIPIYIEYTFVIEPVQPWSEILIAELAEVQFESFVETETGVLAYIRKEDWHTALLSSVELLSRTDISISYQHQEIEQVNWNQAWEDNFSPIVIDNLCYIRAPFHPKKAEIPFEIIIEPKMSFGTGHHETTFMMSQYILELSDLNSCSVADIGCGTGVLAILAKMKGSSRTVAVDIDTWCYENALENCQRNDTESIDVRLGNCQVLENENFDIVLANINRNVLLAELPTYRKLLSTDGRLFLSGFYHEDLAQIKKVCSRLNLRYVSHKIKNNWVAAYFEL